ncbi:MAG: SRPBCC family protein [Thermoanaerobaculia bacterium]
MPTLEFALDLPGVTRSALWTFHGDPAVLERLTPPEKKLRIVEIPATMGRGGRVVLEARQFGVRLRWISTFEEWEPPARFVDVQVKGPFTSWRHEHLFADGRLVDRVTYEVPLARLGGRIVDALLVRPDIERMFAHRHRVTREALLR